MIINNNNRIELFDGCVTIYSGNNVDRIFRQDLVESVSPVDTERICISFISGDKYIFVFRAYLGFEIINASEALVKLSTILGLNTPPLSLNKFRFKPGEAPSINDLQTKLGISSFDNAILIDDTIYFNNIDYSIPNEAFRFSNALIEVVSAASSLGVASFSECNRLVNALFTRVTNIDMSVFSSCASLTTVSIPSANIALSSIFFGCTALQLVYAPNLQEIGSDSFAFCQNLQKLHLPSLVALGESIYNDNIFEDVSGNNIELTIPKALMTIREGEPDGDIAVLTSHNNVTIITV